VDKVRYLRFGAICYTAVCELGFEGVVAKNHSSLYRPNDRGWVKVKNPNYWRRDAEREAVARSHERRARRTPKQSAMAPSPS
jgi:ATP-dependent DNA ligase